MSSTETEALLVRSVDYRETDRIVTLLTTGLGKVGAVAYGARRSKKRFPGALQPFQLLSVVLKTRRTGDLYELAEAEVVESYGAIPADPKRHACAVYGLELAREVTPDAEPDPRTVRALVRFFRSIERDGAEMSTMASVLLTLLTHAGFAPALDRCAVCGRPAPRGKAGHFDASRGIVCSSCGGSGQVISGRMREALIAAASWSRQAECSEAELAVAVRMICWLAHEHIGKELRSWTLLDGVLCNLSPTSCEEP